MLQSLSTLQRQNPAGIFEAASDDPLLGFSGLLHFAGTISGSHALVIAPNGLDLMCSLLRQGCSAATTLRLAERPEHKAYDLVLAPQVAASIQVGRLVHQAQRALVPTGRFLAYVPNTAGDPEDDVCGLMVRTLRLAGFAAVRSRIVSDGLLIRADLAAREWVSATMDRMQA
jgi:hypothetical protein